MGGKRFGSLFEGILKKSPDLANRLMAMAKGKNASAQVPNYKPDHDLDVSAQPDGKSRATPTHRQHAERPEGLVVKKSPITPRIRPRHKSQSGKVKKNTRTSHQAQIQKARIRIKAGKR